MKKTFIILALLLTFGIYSQEKVSYNTKNEAVNFIKSNNLIYLETNEPLSKFSNEKITDSGDNFIIIQTTEENYREKFETFSKAFKNVEPVLIYEDGIKQICFDEIIIKTKSNLEDILKGIDYTFKANEFEKNQYLVRLNNYDTSKTFDLINTLFKDDRIEYVEPNFIKLNVLQAPPNDPLLSSQWSINNNGYLGGTVDADMDVDDAWALATGTGIKVAVLDVGVDLTHPDLQANLLPGYDAINGVPGGGYVGASFHGTACAGIIGAVANNGIGIAGVAYNSKIIPIRVGSATSITVSAAATGTNWAWQNGADILSNSWGGGSASTAVNDAINNAVTSGRGGKGCIVLYSAGNSNSSVAWPALNPQVIAVGATSQCDQRKSPTSCDGETFWGTNYGTNLDVSAPGVKIYTTDIVGSTGYETGDYAPSFNGTSSACPNTAGVMALILSLKPTLTGVEARQVLEQNTDKVGGYTYTAGVTGQPNGTWSNDLGYGRVNAYKALQSIATFISGADKICTTQTYTLQNNFNNFSVVWSVQGALTFTSSGNTITVTTTSTIGSTAIIKATLSNGTVITKTISIGSPLLPATGADSKPIWVRKGMAIGFAVTPIVGATTYDWSIVRTPYPDFPTVCALPIQAKFTLNGTQTINNTTLTTVNINVGTCSSEYMITCTAKNGCGIGTEVYYRYLTAGASGTSPCRKTTTTLSRYNVAQNPLKEGVLKIKIGGPKVVLDDDLGGDSPGIVDGDGPCEGPYPAPVSKPVRTITVLIYDFNGEKVYANKFEIVNEDKENGMVLKEELTIDDLKLKADKYILVIDDGNKPEKQIIVVE
ncbi:S8 family serine peptidase [Flavobacterium psychrophilum]|nr:S8 family serine peptidase [Flavobacterium psychrophilum]MCB5997958.1 S8 family serine peptidase [Flavobacterium psychrophilum]MCB6109476.1 S8 family serine peptidase [Flavobacterium psychrophilum]MCB6111946.1 S8 family serine peptidase [Flavobacterium psychrophilum]